MTEGNDKNDSQHGHWKLLVESPSGKENRFQGESGFDELVVDDWLHVEKMDAKVWWLRVGDARIMVRLSEASSPEVDVIRGFYADIRGETKEHSI